MITNIELNNIDPNPWQTRDVEYPEHVKELADSIRKMNGLMQIPSGRVHPTMPMRIQLAFGHSRLAAYKQLTEQGFDGFATFPVNLVDLSDEQMAVWAFEENEKRKDLDPVERALAVQKMITDFGWNQQQVAEKLSIDRSSVSNLVRLLKMPEEVLNLMKDGVLSQRSATALLPWYELTPIELAIINQRCPEAEDFIALARGGQVQSDTIRIKMDEYLAHLKPEEKKPTELPTELPQESPMVDQDLPVQDNKPAEWVEETVQEDGSKPITKVITTAKPEKKPEPANKPVTEPAPVGAVTTGERMLTVKWTANGVLVGLQEFGKAPRMRFLKELHAVDLPFLLNEMGIE